MGITADSTVGTLAAEHPLATRVFARHGIDYCCGGGKPLRDVCAKRGLDASTVVAEIEAEVAPDDASARNWNEAPLVALIEHIVDTYHVPLSEELPRLEAMARKVNDVHGASDPERLGELVRVFAGLRAELVDHMAKEERVLFPMVRQGLGANAGSPIEVMEHEHDAAGAALRRLRELTDDYRPPDYACTTWRALWAGLEALEGDMHRHIHLENNILFPRALAG